MNVAGILFSVAIIAFAVFEVVSLISTIRKKRKEKKEREVTADSEKHEEDNSEQEVDENYDRCPNHERDNPDTCIGNH